MVLKMETRLCDVQQLSVTTPRHLHTMQCMMLCNFVCNSQHFEWFKIIRMTNKWAHKLSVTMGGDADQRSTKWKGNEAGVLQDALHPHCPGCRWTSPFCIVLKHHLPGYDTNLGVPNGWTRFLNDGNDELLRSTWFALRRVCRVFNTEAMKIEFMFVILWDTDQYFDQCI